MILHRAGEPIDLVDDDRADSAVCHPAKQRLEYRAICRARGLAGVDELACEVPSSLSDVSKAGLPLRGNRIALA